MNNQHSTRPKPFCFVLMPFDSAFNDIYEFGIKGACSEAGLYCERVDEQVFLGSMLDRIYSQISRADLLVADMTGMNPNVFYEVGYAHALGKNVVLLTSVASDIPFDLKHFPHIVYGSEIKTLRTSLAKRLSQLTEQAPSQSFTQIGLELFHGSSRLADVNVIVEHDSKRLPGSVLTLLNNSTKTYAPGEFRVAVIAPGPFSRSRTQDVMVTAMPDGTYMHMLPEFDTLFPGAATNLKFYIDSHEPNAPTEVNVVLRIFSPAGLRDFPLKLQQRATA